MIAVELKGGHSNQLFQYALGRRLAHGLKCELRLDKSWFSEVEAGDTQRFYELADYKFEQKFISKDQFVIAGKDDTGLKPKIYTITKGRFKPRLSLYQEKSMGFDKTVLDLPDKTYLRGYWQTEKYFKDIRPILLEDIELKTKPNKKNSAWHERITNSNSVSLHIRRGDYAENKSTKAFHGLTTMAYYQKAIDLVTKKAGAKNLTLFIFSNDIVWCKANLKFDLPTVFIDGKNSGAEDMRLMKNCKHNIMANSSFSWWGAWLNQNPNKIVIAPKVWFQNKKANAEIEIVPSSWTRL